MNKVFLGLILAVCVLGMALVMLNDRLGRKPEPRPAASVAQPAQERSPEEIAAQARAMELARAALSPPAEKEPEDIQKESLPEPAPEPRHQPRPEAVASRKPPQQPESAPLPEAKPALRQPEPVPRPEPKPEPKPVAEQPKREPQPAAPAKEAASGKTATRFVIYARDKGATVRVGGNAKVEYSSMTLENPNRVVVDLTGDWKFPPNPGIPKNDLVSAVRVGQNGDKTRLVIDLKVKPRKVVLVPFKNGDGVDVRVDK